LEGRYNHLLVAPAWFKRSVLSLIDAEIKKAENGQTASMILKMNSLTDRETLDKLKEASCAGVSIRLIVRGICCLVPGIPGKTENITVTSIIGRFLEHARVFCFGSGLEAKVYISSADLMTRNTERRIEIACPILDPAIRTRIMEILGAQLDESTKAWVLGSDGNYTLQAPDSSAPNSQVIFMCDAIKIAGNQNRNAKATRQKQAGVTVLTGVKSRIKIQPSDNIPT
jgi:polyphosphate kinase